MHVTWITVTYARTKCLNELVAAFQQQDYQGLRELLILNTYPRQTITIDCPNVRIVNLKERPSSLGKARNMAIGLAKDGIIAIADDDDQYLPHHTSLIVKHFETSVDWIWIKRMFYMEGNQIKGAVAGNLNCVSFRKSAFSKIKYPDALTVGEDRDFVGKLTSSCKGKAVHITDREASFIYRWGQTDDSIYHCSGLGCDDKNKVSAHKRVADWVEERVKRGAIRTGTIQLVPALRHNYAAMAADFVKTLPQIQPTAIGIVQLGKAGDLISMLPIAKHICETEQKPYVIVSREFANLLDGVSYVTPFVTDLTYHDLNDATIMANQMFGKVIKTQIYGKQHRQQTICASWPQESWRQGGHLDHYHDPEWKLVFDRRDAKREADLCRKLFKTKKPKIITNFTSAVSVPFSQGQTMLSAVQREFSRDYEVIDIGKLRCERLYDLIGVYEHASVIASIDTSTLHLAAAVDVPLVALVNPNGWLGPVPRYNCAARIPYNQANVKTVCDAIRAAPAFMKAEMERRNAIKVIARPPKVNGSRLNLKQVTLWACCWSDAKEYLIRTLRVLRYCHTIAEWNKIILFSYLPVKTQIGFPLEMVQIPQLTPEGFNIFHIHTVGRLLPETHCLSVHDDGFPINASLWNPKWLEWDYVGACWSDGICGNGGLCLESARFLKAKVNLPFCERLPVPMATVLGNIHVEASDFYVCRTHRKTLEDQGMRFAPREIASQFSTENVDKHIDSWGYHGRHADPIKHARGWDLVQQSEVV